MPESKRRKNKAQRGRQAAEESPASSPLRGSDDFDFKDLDGEDEATPRWYVMVMVGLMLVGLLWIVLFYISQSQLPISAIGSWNIAVGFGLAMIGLFMAMRWK